LGQYHQQLLRQYSFAMKSQTVSRKKVSKTLSYKKAAHKMKAKSDTPGIDFINILRANFLYKRAFSIDTFQLCNFWHQNIGTK